MGKHSYTRESGNGFLEDIEPLSAEISVNSRRSSDVSTRPGETRDNTQLHQIICIGSNDGDRAGRSLCSKNRRRARRHNDIHAEIDQFCCKLRKPVNLTLGPSVLYDDVLSLNITGLSQTLTESFQTG